jgi:hypothetical protein
MRQVSIIGGLRKAIASNDMFADSKLQICANETDNHSISRIEI